MRKRYPLIWLSGFMVALGLMIFDEVLTLARYCGPECGYAIPWLGVWDQYVAEQFSWILILAGFAILMGAAVIPDMQVDPDLALALKGYIEGEERGEPASETKDADPEALHGSLGGSPPSIPEEP